MADRILVVSGGGEPMGEVATTEAGPAHALLGLIGLHVVGVLVESVLTRDNLVRAMITGRKDVLPGEAGPGERSVVAPTWLAALALGTASGIVWIVVA